MTEGRAAPAAASGSTRTARRHGPQALARRGRGHDGREGSSDLTLADEKVTPTGVLRRL